MDLFEYCVIYGIYIRDGCGMLILSTLVNQRTQRLVRLEGLKRLMELCGHSSHQWAECTFGTCKMHNDSIVVYPNLKNNPWLVDSCMWDKLLSECIAKYSEHLMSNLLTVSRFGNWGGSI